MARLFLYIFFLCLPLSVLAQGDIIIGTPQEEQQAEANEITETVKPPVYTQRKFREGFKEKYNNDDDFNYRPKEESQSLLSRFWEWLNNLLDRIFGDNGANHTEIVWKSIIYRVLLVLVIGFAIYFITASIINKGNPWIFKKSKRIIPTYDVDSENIHEMDFPSLIEQTKTAGDYRLALRYYYLLLLKKLSSREIIAWNWDKTNADYIYEIKNEGLRKDFEYLSYLYDYSWYGEFDLDNQAFVKAEKAFQKTLNLL